MNMNATNTASAAHENNAFLTEMIQRLPREQQTAFYRSLVGASNRVRTEAKRLMAIMDASDSAPTEKDLAWQELLNRIRLLPGGGWQQPIGLGASKRGSTKEFSRERSKVETLETQEAEFAERLRRIMKAKQVTQAQLAQRIACTQPAISQMLNRKCRPQRQTLDKIATALQIDVRQLWPDIEVADYLDAVADFGRDGQTMSDEMAMALRDNLPPRPNARGKRLPSWKQEERNGE